MAPEKPGAEPGARPQNQTSKKVGKAWRRFMSPGQLFGLFIFVALLSLRGYDPAALEFLRIKTFDVFQTIKPRLITQRPALIVDVDEDSLREFGQWPWPRSIITKMVDNLQKDGAKVIGFDIIFAEPDRLSPDEIIRALPDLDAATKQRLESMPDSDVMLANALRRSNVVLGQAVRIGGQVDRSAVPLSSFTALGGDPRHFMANYQSLVRNLDVLNAAAKGHGMLNLEGELDGIVRRPPLVMLVQDRIRPSLSMEMLRIASGETTPMVHIDPDVGLLNIVVRPYVIPVDHLGRIWLYFAHTDPQKYIPARDVLNGTFKPGTFKGKMVLVGTSAEGLLDIKSTPLDSGVPGVELHAQIIENVVTGQTLRRPDYAAAAELIAAFVVGVLMLILVPLIGAKMSLLLGTLSIGVMFEGSWYLFSAERLLLDPIYPSVVVLIMYIYLSYINFAREERQRREVRLAFSHYLSPEVVDRLAAEPAKLNLGGEMREMSIMFSDIRRFTSISENLGAEELTSLINSYLTPMSAAVLEHDGTIDKYIGDCIMAFWNAPMPVPLHARQSCLAALAMRKQLHLFNERLEIDAKGKGKPFTAFRMGIGINTGTACVGNVGSFQRFNYSVLGDAVNVASRLESLTKFFSVNSIIGEETRRLAPELATLELDLIALRGKAKAIHIHALLGDESMAQGHEFQQWQGYHQEMINAYQMGDFVAAKEGLLNCVDLEISTPLEQVYNIYNGRLQDLEQRPPEDDWTGIFNFEASTQDQSKVLIRR